MVFKGKQLILLAIVSGLLFALSWPMRGFAFAIFLAFIPLFLIEESIRSDRRAYKSARVFGLAFLAFTVWNLLTTYWIYNAAAIGLAMALFVNGSLMSIAFLVYHKFQNSFNYGKGGQAMLIFPWLTFEYLHQDWDMTWSWLNLGNVFGPWQQWVQWYEYTGAFGGAVWIILLNVLLYHLAKNISLGARRKAAITGGAAVVLFGLPALLSFIIYRNYTEVSRPFEIVVVQPNIDPYNEKYGGMPYDVQLNKMISLAEQKTDSLTEFVVFPESAIQESLWEGEWDDSYSIDTIEAFNARHPQARILMGASTYRRYQQGEPLRISARHRKSDNSYFDAYNTVIFFEQGKPKGLYHKSKLVAGVERMPFSKYLGFIDDLALDFGGIIGTLGTDEVRKVFTSEKDSLRFSSVICYESLYGGFFAEFVRNGAELMFIVTNDGWWGNTAGYRQHYMFAPLRAIETRRSIGRSANTGISAFINQRGDTFDRSGYWEPAVMKQTLNANDRLTFYVKYGDYLARISVFLTVLFLLISFTRSLLPKLSRKNPNR